MPNCKPGDLAVIVGPLSTTINGVIGHFCRIVERVPGDGPTVWYIDPPAVSKGVTWHVFIDAALQPIRGAVLAHRARKGGRP